MSERINTKKMMQVVKENHRGDYIFAWEAQILVESEKYIQLLATFTLPPHPVDRISFNPGDVFIESYFSTRWYNIFEVHDGSSRTVKCWYLNLSRPALFRPDAIHWQDLALDLIFYPDGSQALLDEEEFATLDLDTATREKCWQEIEALRQNFQATPAPWLD